MCPVPLLRPSSPAAVSAAPAWAARTTLLDRKRQRSEVMANPPPKQNQKKILQNLIFTCQQQGIKKNNFFFLSGEDTWAILTGQLLRRSAYCLRFDVFCLSDVSLRKEPRWVSYLLSSYVHKLEKAGNIDGKKEGKGERTLSLFKTHYCFVIFSPFKIILVWK